MKSLPVCRTQNHVTVIHEGRALSLDSSHPNFNQVIEAIKAKDWELVPKLFSIEEAISSWSQGAYKITEDSVTYNGEPLPESLRKRILAFYTEKQDVEPLLRFHTRLAQNPSHRSVNELHAFLEHKNIPIDEEGFFYAYKAVNPNFTDIYSGKVLNTIGAVLEMPRNAVDDNCNNHCSKGYHVGSLEYVKWYKRPDSIILICKVDPADVVSVPLDHSCQKVRTSKYEVVSLYTGPLPETLYNQVSDDEDYDEEDFEEVEDDFDDWDDDTDDEDCEDENCEEPSVSQQSPSPSNSRAFEIISDTQLPTSHPVSQWVPVCSSTVEEQDKKITKVVSTLKDLLDALR